MLERSPVQHPPLRNSGMHTYNCRDELALQTAAVVANMPTSRIQNDSASFSTLAVHLYVLPDIPQPHNAPYNLQCTV